MGYTCGDVRLSDRHLAVSLTEATRATGSGEGGWRTSQTGDAGPVRPLGVDPVESAWGAVPGFPLVRFPRPLDGRLGLYEGLMSCHTIADAMLIHSGARE